MSVQEAHVNITRLTIIWPDPAHPREERQRGEDVSGEEIYGNEPGDTIFKELILEVGFSLTVASRAYESDNEEALSADAAARADAGVMLRVQRIKQRAQHEIRGPN